MKQKIIIIAIDGTRYQIARFKLELASYLLGRIIRAVRVSAPADHSDRPAPEPADPKDKPSSEDIARAMIGAGLFGDMDRASREEIQTECMKVCARIEGDLPMPLNQQSEPAMDRTAFDNDLDAGKWCRFCPAKLVCPLMHSLFGAAMLADPTTIINLSDEALGRSYQYIPAVKSFLKAMETETLARRLKGHEVPFTKLVQQKTNRVWKEGASERLANAFGQEAYTKPALKSPPQIEELGQVGKELAKELAYKPDSGLTIAGLDDRRRSVSVQTVQETFANANLDTPAEAS